MKCRKCNEKMKVLETRNKATYTRRRYQCEECGTKLTTYTTTKYSKAGDIKTTVETLRNPNE